MRIGFAIYGHLDQVSGGFAYDRSLIRELVALGHQVDVLSQPWLSYGRALASNLTPAPAVAARGSTCDVLVEDELIHPSLLRGGRFWRTDRSGRPRPRVALIHNLKSQQPGELLAWLKVAVERRYLRGVDGAIAVCGDTLAGVRELLGNPTTVSKPRRLPLPLPLPFPTLVAYPGRDDLQPRDAVRGSTDGPLRLLYVAAVVRHKGLHRLFEALARAPALSFQLDVVGNLNHQPGYVRALKKRALAAGISSRIRWHGEQQGEALWNLYRENQLFALPSDREAYSLACLEAQAFGLPVLATSRGGLAEMFPDATAGLLLAPDEPLAWAAALVDLAEDRGRLARMAAAAWANHRRHQTWRQVAIAVQRFLLETVARSR